MIAFYRTGEIASGRLTEAVTFAKEVAGYVEQTTGVAVGVALPVGGNPNRVGWSATYDDLAGLETMTQKLMADPKYMELVTSNSAHFIEGSIRDEIWSTV
ncbi:hypothetical protein GCM10009623_36730 [Nocardioides aestuarii]|uniref:Stress-response A/B barrel domain-containing protein n=1 Tax=Nocardioides aestuarii TaxID=252231 RepID=A0ABW4TTJ6_9ACTN